MANDAQRHYRRFMRNEKRKKKKGDGGIGPDGPRRESSPGFGGLTDTGRGLGGTRRQRNKPKPKRLTAGPRPNRPNRPNRGGNRGRGNRGGGNRGGATPVSDPFRSEVNALAQLQYGPQERELAYQKMVEAQRGVNVNDWYTQHYQRALQAAQATQAGYQAAQAQAYGQANQTLASDQTQNASLLAQQNQQAAIRGTATDPMLAQQMQQGAQVRQQQQTQFGNQIGTLGANEAAYGQTRAFQAAEQGIQAGQDVQARQRKVESLTRELLGDKGAFKVKARGELKEAEHKRNLETAVFGEEIRSNLEDEENDRRDDRREGRENRWDRRMDRAKLNLDKMKARDDRWKDRNQSRLDRAADIADDGRRNFSRTYSPSDTPAGGSKGGGKGPGGSFTPTQVRSGRKALRNLVGRVKSNVDPPDSVDPLLAQAAVQIADNGGVTPALAKKIRRQYGFTPKIKRTSWQKRRGDDAREGAQDFF